MSQQSITVTGDTSPTVEVTADGSIVVTVSSGPAQNVFNTFAVAGQGNVVADSTNDTLTFIAGTNISITTNPSTDSITINSTGSGDVAGPASATDNALVRFDGTTGKLVQNGVITESDTGDLAAVNSLAFDTTPTGSLTTQGQAMWNVDEETVDIQLNGFALHVGEHVVYHVKNSTGSQIVKGVPVMFAGTTGNSGKLLIQPWNGTGPSTYFMGLTAETLDNGEEGFVIAFGKLRGIQTNGGNYGESWVDGEIIYIGTTSGSLTKTQPAAPNPHIQVCAVVHAHASNGTLFIRPTLGSNIKDDEGVTISSLASGQILVANSGGTVFFNKSVSGDATLADTGALTLATVNSNVGSFGSATAAPAITVNGKGLITAVSTNTITPAVGSITGLGTNVATSLGNNMGASGTLAILGANTFTGNQTAPNVILTASSGTFQGVVGGAAPQFTAVANTSNGMRVAADRVDFWIGGAVQFTVQSGVMAIGSTALNFGSNTQLFGNSDGTGRLIERNGTSAQTFSIANTYTSFTNKEELEIGWVGNSNVGKIRTIKGSGGGTARQLMLGTDSVDRMGFEATTFNTFMLASSGSYGSGSGVLFLGNATTVPTTNPTDGGILYVEAGALKYRGSSGTVTTIANA